MLKRLHLENVGPASVMDVAFADRLNVFTGDNGLGKTFILDVAWWLSSNSDITPAPKPGWQNQPRIKYELDLGDGVKHLQFDARRQMWHGQPFIESCLDQPILGIYARGDGSFSIVDSLRTTEWLDAIATALKSLELSVDALWQGLKADDQVLCNGLISDWIRWQNQPDQYNFRLLWSIIEKLFPAEETPRSGQPTRISLNDVRDIPTIQLAYGTIPITQLSSGMKRILNLAYSLVWVWSEHKQAAKLANSQAAGKLLLLVDEIESHLHPQWQRSIFPAILEAIKLLDPEIKVQLLTTTHSPLVLASLEPHFDKETDKLFGFDLVDREVVLEELPWVKLGEVDDWLTSPIFGLSRPRSKEAEVAINAAFAFMRKADMSVFPASLQTQDSIHQELLRLLPDDDEFWDRWIVTARMPIAQG
jgi:AAA domain, putative AbiEii toxin, Type IV TA system